VDAKIFETTVIWQGWVILGLVWLSLVRFGYVKLG
jgi:hypothetical protein